MVLSDKSKKGEVTTMLTLMPDSLAPDSTAHACLGNMVARAEVSKNNKPGVSEGGLEPGTSARIYNV